MARQSWEEPVINLRSLLAGLIAFAAYLFVALMFMLPIALCLWAFVHWGPNTWQPWVVLIGAPSFYRVFRKEGR